jgi:hypothetical protein
LLLLSLQLLLWLPPLPTLRVGGPLLQDDRALAADGDVHLGAVRR